MITGYSYAFQPGGVLGAGRKPGWDGLNNSIIFTWGFVEMLVWFWVRAENCTPSWCATNMDSQIFTSLREERHLIAVRVQKQHKAEENML